MICLDDLWMIWMESIKNQSGNQVKSHIVSTSEQKIIWRWIRKQISNKPLNQLYILKIQQNSASNFTKKNSTFYSITSGRLLHDGITLLLRHILRSKRDGVFWNTPWLVPCWPRRQHQKLTKQWSFDIVYYSEEKLKKQVGKIGSCEIFWWKFTSLVIFCMKNSHNFLQPSERPTPWIEATVKLASLIFCLTGKPGKYLLFGQQKPWSYPIPTTFTWVLVAAPWRELGPRDVNQSTFCLVLQKMTAWKGAFHVGFHGKSWDASCIYIDHVYVCICICILDHIGIYQYQYIYMWYFCLRSFPENQLNRNQKGFQFSALLSDGQGIVEVAEGIELPLFALDGHEEPRSLQELLGIAMP